MAGKDIEVQVLGKDGEAMPMSWWAEQPLLAPHRLRTMMIRDANVQAIIRLGGGGNVLMIFPDYPFIQSAMDGNPSNLGPLTALHFGISTIRKQLRRDGVRVAIHPLIEWEAKQRHFLFYLVAGPFLSIQQLSPVEAVGTRFEGRRGSTADRKLCHPHLHLKAVGLNIAGRPRRCEQCGTHFQSAEETGWHTAGASFWTSPVCQPCFNDLLSAQAEFSIAGLLQAPR